MTVIYKETFATAVVMNIIVVVLCISINYINATMVHTFNKHHVCAFVFLHLKPSVSAPDPQDPPLTTTV